MDSLAETVVREQQGVERFVALLREEQEVLGSGAIDDLGDLVERKTLLAGELSDIAACRNALLAAAGLPADRPGMTAWLETRPAAEKIRAAWQQVLTLAVEARELNRVNGELIKVRMQHNANALEALLGAARPLKLYGPDGQTTPHGPGRINDAA